MISIIDYGMGNVRSVANAFDVIGQNAEITNDIETIENSDAIVLPGVGAFNDGMKNLQKLGLIEILNEQVLKKKKPYLGICLGLEFLAKHSYEGGQHDGFGWVNGVVRRISPNHNLYKVPHMGWDDTLIQNNSILLNELLTPSFYYLHSYYLEVENSEKEFVTSMCDYGGVNIIGSIEKNNIYAVQFHPEKSQNVGLKLLQNFVEKVDYYVKT